MYQRMCLTVDGSFLEHFSFVLEDKHYRRVGDFITGINRPREFIGKKDLTVGECGFPL